MVITMAEEKITTRIEEIRAKISTLEAQKEPHVQAIANLGNEITTLEAQKEPHIDAIIQLEAEIVARHFLIKEFKGLLPEEEPVVEPEPEPEPEPVEPTPEEEQPPSD